ncbi:hypothetical protein [Jiulongibacter sp. NS-SX5]|uniref:hypothetical protein n=1 Tax=Jiulongibacter sp. NS-SX5 TaxID=3463854 RepID=UPI00405997A9
MDKEKLLELALQNKLSEAERLTFEQMLKEDVIPKSQYDFEREIQEGINQKERYKLKELFKEQERMRVFPLWAKWAAAAMILLSFTWFLWPKNDLDKNLYASYYQKFPNVVSPITRGENQEEDAFRAYENGEYDKALDLLNLSEGDTARFYQSMTLLELNRDQDAIRLLKEQSYESILDAYRLWYLSLAYLKNDQKDKAKPLLQKLSQIDFPLRDKAEELLFKIK